jgi:adenylate cyclase
MIATNPSPAPRSYPPFVHLLRRAQSGRAVAPTVMAIDEVERWLLGEALLEEDLLNLYESLVWRFVAAGLPLDRASLHVGTLHPQLFGFAWNWDRADGLCDEVKVEEASLKSDAYRRNPLFQVIEQGKNFRGKMDDREMVSRHPLLAELAARGITDYVAVPLRAGGAYHNAATAATAQEGGFSESQLAGLHRLLKVFALHVERHIALRIAGNVLETYLGAAAGRLVLDGSIKRGGGEAIRAIIWASDLRGFTDLIDRLEGPDMIKVLNAYFECLAAAIMEHGGEVLKFIGDGLLAVFPYAAFESEKAAAEASLAAAEQALEAVGRLSAEAPPDLASIDGWRPLRSGIALHEGEVFFGNVGAPARLDFTVIGRAVNATSRVEALCKSLGRSILVTQPVAQHLNRPLEELGEHALRGLSGRIAIFGLGE